MSAPYTTELRRELVRAVGAQRDRRVARQRRLVSLSAAAAAVLLIVGGFALADGAARPAIAVAAGADGVTVTLVDASADPAALTRELADAGVQVVVVGQPVPPELAGRWVGGTGRILRLTATSVTLPAGARGVTLAFGVASDTPSIYSGSAFAPGGLLACSGLAGAPAEQVAAELDRRELPHRWLSDEGVASVAVPVGTFVTEATLTSTGTLLLATSPDSASTSDHVAQRCE